MTYARLASLLSQGAEVNPATEEFDFNTYLQTPHRRVWPLFAINTRDRIYVFSEESQPAPKAGWHVLGLVKEDAAKEEARTEARAEAAAEKVAADKQKGADKAAKKD